MRDASAFAGAVPKDWTGGDHFLLPLHVHDAAWLHFSGRIEQSRAVKVGTGGINALTGEPWDVVLRKRPQNYIVSPYQPWLDGFKTGPGAVRQFVAVPRGRLTVEHQLTGASSGGIRIACFPPRDSQRVPANCTAGRHKSRARARRGRRSTHCAAHLS